MTQKSISPVVILLFALFCLLVVTIVVQQITSSHIREEHDRLEQEVSRLRQDTVSYQSQIQELRSDLQVQAKENRDAADRIHLLEGRFFGRRNVTVFLGDSITARGEWSKWFPGKYVVNCGVPGDTTEDVLNRLDPILAEEPGRVILMVGINDVNRSSTTQQIINNYSVILEKMSPVPEVVVVSVLPISHDKYNHGRRLPKIDNRQVYEIDYLLEQMSGNYRNVRYLDLIPLIVDQDNEMRLVYTLFDGVHLSPEGYTVWRKALDGIVR